MSRLSESVTSVMHILDGADLGADYTVSQLLDETTARRSLDLSDLSPQEQAALVEGRAINLIPSAAVLAEKIEAARTEGRQFVIKYGIDPTSPDVHLGHAVPANEPTPAGSRSPRASRPTDCATPTGP
ncbi:hypothetical protein ACWF2L_12475 [Streptomyces anulatus]